MARDFESDVAAEHGAGLFDLRTAINTFRHWMWLFVGIVCAVLSVTLIIIAALPTEYTATASVVVNPFMENNLKSAFDAANMNAPYDPNLVDTAVQEFRSRDVIQLVVDQLNVGAAQIRGETNESLFHRATEFLLGRKPTASSSQGPTANLSSVSAHLDVQRADATNIINISFSGKDPAVAAKTANLFIDNYLQMKKQEKYKAAKAMLDELDRRLVSLRQQVMEADEKIASYKASHGLLSAQGETLTEQEISTLDQQLATARAYQAEQDAKLSTAKAQLAKGSSGEDIGDALQSPVVQELRKQIAETSQTMAQLAAHEGESHPDLIKARSRIAELQSQMRAEIARIASNLSAQAQIAQERTASVQNSIDTSRARLADNNTSMVGLSELERNADLAKSLYGAFLDRYKQTSSLLGMEHPSVEVFSRATPPLSPSKPQKLVIFGFGLCLGLLLAVTATMVAQALFMGLSNAEDVRTRLGIPNVGFIPTLKSTVLQKNATTFRPWEYVVREPSSAFAERFRSLWVSMTWLGKSAKVVAFISALPSEGKTTSALCLGRVLAIAGYRPIVVDCDLRLRGTTRLLRQKPHKGLVEVLAGSASLSETLVSDDATGLKLLPVGAEDYSAGNMWSAARFEQLLSELRDRFDLVILDLPPALAMSDGLMLAPFADQVILLARWRRTPAKAVQAALQSLRDVGANVAGACLTFVDVQKQSNYAYSDPSAYFRSYQSYFERPAPKRTGRRWPFPALIKR